MLDIKFIRENPQKIKEACQKKGVNVDIDNLLELDKKKRELLTKLENFRADQNKISKQKERNDEAISRAKELKNQTKKLELDIEAVESALDNLLILVPNIPFDEVPVGKDDSGNIVLKKVGKTPDFMFPIKDHLAIGENLGIIDIEKAAKVAGPRFGYIKGKAVLLELALIKLAFNILQKEKFEPILPPVMIKEEMATGTGYFEATDSEEAYFLPKDNLYLVGTSEQSLIAMHAKEVFNEKDLPKRYVGFSTCFRREAGSYGKDTKGILRVHQFDKVEMVSFCKSEDSKKEHQLLLSLEEKLMRLLKLPYQVVNVCTGDLGRPAAAKYDIETWLPSEKRYRETHSTSNCTDFQARRLNIRWHDKLGRSNFVHTLNGTVFAIGRIIIAILENNHQKDGSVKIPKILQKYTGFKVIHPIK